MNKNILAASFAILFLIYGCATLPQEAETHLYNLKEFHIATTKGTIAAYDTSVNGLSFTIEKVRETNQEDWNNYITDINAAADKFSNFKNGLDQIIFLHSLQKEPSDANEKKVSAKIKAELQTLLQLSEKSQKNYEKYSSAASNTKDKDNNALLSHKLDIETSSKKLRDLIEENNKVIEEAIQKQKDLVRSYLLVQKNRKEVLGVELSNSAQKLNKKTSELSKNAISAIDKYSKIIDIFRNK